MNIFNTIINKIEKNTNVIILIIFSISYFLLTYKGFGIEDHHQYLPSLFRMLSPDYLINDWYVNSSEGYNERYFLNVLILAFMKIGLDVGTSFFVLTLLFFLILVISIFYLCKYFIEEERKSLLITLVIISSQGTRYLGSYYFFEHYLVSGFSAWAIIILSMCFIIRKKIAIGFFIMGIANFFQVVTGCIAFGVFYLWHLLMVYSSRSNLNIFAITKPFTFFIFGSINMILASSFNENFIDKNISYIIAYIRHPWHSVLTSMEFGLFISTILFVIIISIYFKKSSIKNTKLYDIKYLIFFSFLFSVAGFIFTEIFPINFVSKAQFIPRSMNIIILVSYIMLFDILVEKSLSKNIQRKLYFVFIILCFVTTFSALFSMTLLIVSEIYTLKRLNYNQKRVSIGLIILSLSLIIVSSYFIDLIHFDMNTYNNLIQKIERSILTDFSVTSGIIILFIIFYTLSIIKNSSAKNFTIVLLLLGLIIYPLSDSFPRNIKNKEVSIEFEEVASFIKTNINYDKIILTPPRDVNWRLGLNRAIVVDFKAIPFKDNLIYEWYDRIIDVCNKKFVKYDKSLTQINTKLNQFYNTHDKKSLLNLQDKYSFDYAVFDFGKELDFPIVFSNHQYIVYKISNK